MTEQTKANVALGLFMGYELSSSDRDFSFYTHPDGKGITIQSHHDYQRWISHGLMESRGFIFHRSWDWLMLVVYKIEKLFSEYAQKDGERIRELLLMKWNSFTFVNGELKITANLADTFMDCVEFAKWYSKQKVENEKG